MDSPTVIIPVGGLTVLVLTANVIASSSADVRVIKHVVRVVPDQQCRSRRHRGISTEQSSVQELSQSAPRMAQNAHMETAMPMNLLDQIADRPMPYVTNDKKEIENLRVLHKAGHVLCQLPSEQIHRHEAVVHQVTALGRRVLRHFGPSATYGQPGFWH